MAGRADSQREQGKNARITKEFGLGGGRKERHKPGDVQNTDEELLYKVDGRFSAIKERVG